MSAKVRPTGVTILAILEIVSGVIAIGFGVVFNAMLGTVGIGMMELGSVVLLTITGGLMALGAVSFLLAWGLLKGKSWAWTITLIITIISLVFDLVGMNIIGLIIEFVILYYLFRPHVKAYFGKSDQVF